MHRIRMSKNYYRSGVSLSGKRAYANVLAKVFARYSFDRSNGTDTAGGAGNQGHHSAAAILVTRGRFGFNQSTGQGQQFMLTRGEMVAQGNNFFDCQLVGHSLLPNCESRQTIHEIHEAETV